MTAPTPVRRPLLIGPVSEALDHVLGLAAASGVEVDVATDWAAARPSWRTAPLVLVVDRRDPPPQRDRRSDVLLVSGDLDDVDVWRRAHLWGAEHVVMLPDGRELLMEKLADAGSSMARASTVTVVGGRGGAGASTLACALAIHASSCGVPTALVDADASGAGIELVLGAEDAFGVRWDDLAHVEGRVAGATLVEAMPKVQGLPFLSCSRDQRDAVIPEALLAVVAALREVRGLVVLDAPRGDAQVLSAAVQDSGMVLVVSPAEIRAAAAASRLVERIGGGGLGGTVRSVVRLPRKGGLDAALVASSVGAESIGVVRDDDSAAAAIDSGRGLDVGRRSPWRQVCDAVLAELPADVPTAVPVRWP